MITSLISMSSVHVNIRPPFSLDKNSRSVNTPVALVTLDFEPTLTMITWLDTFSEYFCQSFLCGEIGKMSLINSPQHFVVLVYGSSIIYSVQMPIFPKDGDCGQRCHVGSNSRCVESRSTFPHVGVDERSTHARRTLDARSMQCRVPFRTISLIIP